MAEESRHPPFWGGGGDGLAAACAPNPLKLPPDSGMKQGRDARILYTKVPF
jgi:hypothetical protein